MAAVETSAPVTGWVFAAATLSYWGCAFAMFSHFRRAGSAKGARALTPLHFIAGSAFLGIGTAAFTSSWGLSLAPFAAAFSITLGLAFTDPALAAAFMVAGTLLRPWELLDIPAMALIPKLGFGLCGLAWFTRGLRTGRFKLDLSRPVLLFIGFFTWVLLSALLSGDAETALSEFNNSFLITTVVFLLLINSVDTADGLRLLRATLVWSALGIIGAAIASTLLGPAAAGEAAGGVHRLEISGMFGNSNDLAALIVLTLPLLVIPRLSIRRSRGISLNAIAIWGMAGMLIVGLWATQSRGAVLGLFACIGAYLIGRSRNPFRGAILAALVVPLMLGAMSLVSHLRHADDLTESTDSRLNFMLAGLNMAAHYPLLGAGFGNYPRLYQMYAPGIGFEGGQRTAHSTWVLAMAETGFPGFFLFSAFFLLILHQAWKLRKTSPELFPAMVSYGVAMSFLSHTYIVLPYLLFALILIATRCARAEVRPVAPATTVPSPVSSLTVGAGGEKP